MTTGERIKKFRKAKGFTQEQLASKIGVSVMTIRRFESGTREPKIKMLESIADVLEIPVSGLFDFEQPFEIIGQLTDALHDNSHAIVEAGKNVVNDFYAYDSKYIVHYWDKLNDTGKIEATKRVYEMTKLPEYMQSENDFEDSNDESLQNASD